MAIDWLGGYEIEWEGAWTIAQQQELLGAINSVSNRINKLIRQINGRITHINEIRTDPNVITNKADALVDKLELLRSNFAQTLYNILSSSYHLEIYIRNLPSGVKAEYRASSVPWFDDELRLPPTWFGSGDIQVIFHELTHTWTDDGESDNPFINAHDLDILYATDFSNWIYYKSEYKKIFE